MVFNFKTNDPTNKDVFCVPICNKSGLFVILLPYFIMI